MAYYFNSNNYLYLLIAILNYILFLIILINLVSIKYILKDISIVPPFWFYNQRIVWNENNICFSLLGFKTYIYYVWKLGEKDNIISLPEEIDIKKFTEDELINIYNKSQKCNVLKKFCGLSKKPTIKEKISYYYIHKIIYEFIINKNEVSVIIALHSPIIFSISIILSSIISK